MRQYKLKEVLDLYKRGFAPANAKPEILEPLGDWDLYVRKKTEGGKVIIEILMEPPKKHGPGEQCALKLKAVRVSGFFTYKNKKGDDIE